MEFLAPFFAIAGVAAAGIPLALHLLRRTPTTRLPFSLVRFLKPDQPRLTRRSTIEHWPLLLLRILALVLLGLAFARPFQRQDDLIATANRPGRNVALLIDRSASMQREGLRRSVVEQVQSITSQLEKSDRLRVALFSHTTQTIVSVESWQAASSGERKQLIDRLCEEYAADWYATDTGLALQHMADELVQDAGPGAEHEIVLVTDFQEGSDFSAITSGDWPQSVRVSLHQVTTHDENNASLHTMRDRRTGKVLLRVSNDADATTTRFSVQPLNRNGLSAGPAVPVETLPGRQTTLPISSLTLTEDATGLSLLGDAHSFDNRIALPVHRPRTSRIAHGGSTDVNDADSMRYYLQRAIDGMASEDNTLSDSGIDVFDIVTSEGLVLPVTDDTSLVVLTETVPPELLPTLQALLDRGGVIVAALGSMEMGQSVGALLPDGMGFSEAVVDDYAMLGRIDFEHPLFAGFSDARFADFSSIRFWKHREITFPGSPDADAPAPWTVIARFDSGLPAVVRFVGANDGELYLLASGWHPHDSQWALSSRFAPMLSGFLDLARPPQTESRRVLTGDIFDPAEEAACTQWELQRPDGTRQSSEDTVDSPAATLIQIDQPGRYTLQGSTGSEDITMTLLAEVPPEESRTAALPKGQLDAMGLTNESRSSDLNKVTNSNSLAQASAEQLEADQNYWRWFLLSGLTCLVFESLLAAVIRRRQLETV